MGDHSIGAVELLRALFPEVVELAFLPITYLGDPWLLLFGLLVTFWFVDRRDGGTLLGLAAGMAGLVIALKLAFALDRPGVGPAFLVESVPSFLAPVYYDALDPSGHSFPSGHAMGSTVVWVGAAWLLDVGRRRTRFAVAGVVVALVAVSRVVLGVHFAVDVLAGVCLGFLFLLGAITLVDVAGVDRWPGLFGIAVVTGGVGVALGGYGGDAQLVAGAGIGALVAWRVVGIPGGAWSRSLRGVGAAAVGIAVFVVPVAIGEASGVPGSTLLGMAFGFGGAVALPGAIQRASGATAEEDRDLARGDLE